MASFFPGSERVRSIVRGVVERCHNDLDDSGASIGVVMAYADLDKDSNPKGFAMVKHGRRVLGKAKVNNQADRADGKPDATITLDGDFWDGLIDDPAGMPRLEALVDASLACIVPEREPAFFGAIGDVLRDILGRPVLKGRPFDYHLTGHLDVIARNGVACEAVREVRAWADEHGPVIFAQVEQLRREGDWP